MNKNYDNILDFVSLKVICRKPDVLKLVRCVCEWFFALHSLIVLRKINVVCCRLNRWSSAEILNLISGHVIDYLTYLMTLFFIAFSVFGNKLYINYINRQSFIEGDLLETKCHETCSMCL